MNEDSIAAMLFAFAGAVAAAAAGHRVWRSAQGRPWFNGDSNFATDYVSTPALVMYVLVSWGVAIALAV